MTNACDIIVNYPCVNDNLFDHETQTYNDTQVVYMVSNSKFNPKTKVGWSVKRLKKFCDLNFALIFNQKHQM